MCVCMCVCVRARVCVQVGRPVMRPSMVIPKKKKKEEKVEVKQDDGLQNTYMRFLGTAE